MHHPAVQGGGYAPLDRGAAMSAINKRLARISDEASKWSIYECNPLDGGEVLARLVERWAGKRRDNRILEVGTCRCVSASLLAAYGNVVTLDMWAYSHQDAVLDALGQRSNIIRVIGPPEKVRSIIHGPFDFAFIDAHHDYSNIMRDTAFVLQHTNRILYHDYEPKAFPGVVQALDELSELAGIAIHHDGVFAALEYPQGFRL